jgi:hypothetical protein
VNKYITVINEYSTQNVPRFLLLFHLEHRSSLFYLQSIVVDSLAHGAICTRNDKQDTWYVQLLSGYLLSSMVGFENLSEKVNPITLRLQKQHVFPRLSNRS